MTNSRRKLINLTGFALCALMLSASQSAYAQKMYRCGSTFSQTPCGADAKEIEIKALDTGGSSQSSTRKLSDLASEETKAKTLNLCKQAILLKLKDPDSAKFEDISRNAVERRIPVLDGPMVKTAGFNGYVNAKNSYGGYAGRKLFACYLDYETESKYLLVHIFD